MINTLHGDRLPRTALCNWLGYWAFLSSDGDNRAGEQLRIEHKPQSWQWSPHSPPPLWPALSLQIKLPRLNRRQGEERRCQLSFRRASSHLISLGIVKAGRAQTAHQLRAFIWNIVTKVRWAHWQWNDKFELKRRKFSVLLLKEETPTHHFPFPRVLASVTLIFFLCLWNVHTLNCWALSFIDLEIRGQPARISFHLYHVCPMTKLRFGGKHCYPLGHLAGPV